MEKHITNKMSRAVLDAAELIREGYVKSFHIDFQVGDELFTLALVHNKKVTITELKPN